MKKCLYCVLPLAFGFYCTAKSPHIRVLCLAFCFGRPIIRQGSPICLARPSQKESACTNDCFVCPQGTLGESALNSLHSTVCIQQSAPNCLLSTVCTQQSAFNSLHSTVCPQLSSLNSLHSTVCILRCCQGLK